MQYRIKVMLPQVCYWESVISPLNEGEKELAVKGLMETLKAGEMMSIEDDDGTTYIFPSKLLERCVVSLERCE